MLTHPHQPSPEGSFDPACPGHTNEPDDDTWNMPLPSEQAALEALQWSWSEAYDIGVNDGQWWYRRKDHLGGTQTAFTADQLRTQIAADYCFHPVPRPPPHTSTTT